MSVNWYLDDGINQYTLYPYQDISKIKKIPNLESSKFSLRTASLVSYIKNFNHELHDYKEGEGNQSESLNYQSVMAKVVMSSPPIT